MCAVTLARLRDSQLMMINKERELMQIQEEEYLQWHGVRWQDALSCPPSLNEEEEEIVEDDGGHG